VTLPVSVSVMAGCQRVLFDVCFHGVGVGGVEYLRGDSVIAFSGIIRSACRSRHDSTQNGTYPLTMRFALFSRSSLSS